MPRKKQCLGEYPCKSYELTQKQFRRARAELWDYSFNSTFGKLATKLYREFYKKAPPQRWPRTKRKPRDPVNVYPCGILEAAYRQLMANGVPLVKHDSKQWTALVLENYQRWEQLERAWVKAFEAQADVPRIDTAA